MNNNLDHLIPQEILNLLQPTRINIDLLLTASSAQGRWPCATVKIDDLVIWQGTVECQHRILWHGERDSKFSLRLLYHNKGINDTVVDSHGLIVENQSLNIGKILVNDVDLIKTGLIHQVGSYHMDLSREKRQYFLENNISVGPTTHTQMYENGQWIMQFGVPVLSHFTALRTPPEPIEKVPYQLIMQEIHQQIENIHKTKIQNTC